jgi:ABC-2 type transport system permease protein
MTSATIHPVRDSITMLRRQVLHMRRYPSLTLTLLGMPIVFLLLFVYVFGGTLGDGLGGPTGGRSAYLEYLTPGIMMLTIASGVIGTAISVAMDMTEGIVARFRTMAIARVSVLTGHVGGSMIQTLLAMVVVTAVAVLIGFRPNATLVEWLAVVGLLASITFGLTWLTVALGMVSDNVEAASNLPQPLVFLPFLGSGFVPTDSLPTGLRWFAEYQPFTSMIETLRGLLLGTAIGNSAAIALAWSAGIGLVGYLWARRLYNRDPAS